MTDPIQTSAEAAENAELPRRYDVQPEAATTDGEQPVPQAIAQQAAAKSPARWAYERLVLYLQEFEKHLDGEHEAAMGFTGGDAGVLRIEGMGYFDPDMVTFYGSDPAGGRTQLVQHVTQLNVMLRAVPKAAPEQQARRIGFQLAEDLDKDAAAPATHD